MPTRQTKPPFTVLLLCIAACWFGLAMAEPTTVPRMVDEAPAVNADVAAQKGPDLGAASGADVPNPSNTIKMLLEMQASPEPAASAGDGGRRAVRSSSRPAAQSPAPNPFGNGENPFGASPVPARSGPPAASQPVAIDWAAGAGGGALGSTGGVGGISVRNPELFPPQHARGSSRDEPADQRWWMPMALIRWVREHRQAVLIGAVVALGLAWAGTSYSQRRR
jgi:hypothetical protein